MRVRQINFRRHPIQGRQALAILLECWRENQDLPVVLITGPRLALAAAKNIRVSMSKERAKVPEENRLQYGFKLSDPFPYTDEAGIRGEAVIVRWNMTLNQHFKNILEHSGLTLPEGFN
jgi:hypothetical protein